MNAHASRELIAEIQKAMRQLRNGRRADALLIYDEVAQCANANVAVSVQLGHFCSELGSPDQAVGHYRTAVDHEPNNPIFLGYLGVALQQMGHPEEALNTLNRAMTGNEEIHLQALLGMLQREFMLVEMRQCCS